MKLLVAHFYFHGYCYHIYSSVVKVLTPYRLLLIPSGIVLLALHHKQPCISFYYTLLGPVANNRLNGKKSSELTHIVLKPIQFHTDIGVAL